MASVQLQNVTKAWGEVVVSKDINLDIHEGEFVVFVGPSGCGKSTLLRMIAGLETITSGDLFIGEKRMNDTPPAERGVGMVFQSYALYPHLSVAENMSFGLKLAGAKKEVINQRVNQVAEVLQLAHLLDRKPKALSGGQRQRVAIGRTLVAEPSVFLLDEPLSNLDAALRVQMRIEISRLHKRLGRISVPMWPVALSGRLPVEATVGRYPAVKLIGRDPIPYRESFPRRPCDQLEHPALPPVSRSYSGVWGRSVTHYSPVRHSHHQAKPDGSRSTCMC